MANYQDNDRNTPDDIKFHALPDENSDPEDEDSEDDPEDEDEDEDSEDDPEDEDSEDEDSGDEDIEDDKSSEDEGGISAPSANAGSTDSSEKKWYVVRVQSNKEEKVKRSLEQRVENLGWKEHVGSILVPTELVSEIKRGVKRIVERKLYPGYVMMEMNLSEEIHFMIKSTPGVGDIAGVMSENEVERLFLTCDHAREKPKPRVSFEKGQVIKIKEGAFEGYDGIVDEVNEQKGVIKVRISIFGRYTQVELGYWQVENII